MKKILLLAIWLIMGAQNTDAQVIEDFESWNPYTIGFIGAVQMNEPIGWSCTDSLIVGIGKTIPSFNVYQAQLSKESPGYAGTGAMRVSTKTQGAITIPTLFGLPSKDYPAIVSNSTFSLDLMNLSLGQKGGTPITFSPASTSMYVKNTVVSGDSTFVTATLLKQGSLIDTIIATADTVLTANISSYTQISLPFNYILNNQVPNLVRYTISSGNPLALLDTTGTFAVHGGTEIVIDNIELSAPNGIKQLIHTSPIAKVYPTISADVLYINMFKQMKNIQLEIYSSNGQLVKSEDLLANRNQVSVSNLAKGTYIFSLKVDSIIYQTGKFVR